MAGTATVNGEPRVRPIMETVVDSVHVLPLEVEGEDGPRRFNPTAVETDAGVVLLDVGFPHTVDQLETGLASIGYGLDDIALILLTHHDGDHASGLAAVTGRVDTLVAAHAEEVPYVDGRAFPIKTPDDQERYEPVPVDLELVGDEAVRTAAGPMELIHVPGHSPGMLAAYLPQAKVLIAADAMVSEDGLAGPKPHFTPDMETATESVGRLADLDVEHVVCYHGGAVEATTEDVAAVYDSLQS